MKLNRILNVPPYSRLNIFPKNQFLHSKISFPIFLPIRNPNPNTPCLKATPMAFQTPNHDSGSESNNNQKRLYNPYKDLEVPIRNLYQLPTSPEHLFVEEARRKHRSWGENVTFYTGCGYLAGAVGGAGVGLVEAVKAFESGDTNKLRINRVLNTSGHSGRVWGNRLGVIGLLYAGIESGIAEARDTDDVWNSVAAGLGTGALYRAARGVRSAAVAGAVGGVVVGVVVTAKQALKRYVPI